MGAAPVVGLVEECEEFLGAHAVGVGADGAEEGVLRPPGGGVGRGAGLAAAISPP
ncbi:hypothetical protein [Rhodococcus oxybenzonivorans]|uniref:hypothetical protein n=1 Tax=Rhodococcus oxybenzonivorans TaxID=1990687 RepID=UPI001E65A2AE|nr:hypothetical protein [Rhodococcus oxybenzonivorans]